MEKKKIIQGNLGIFFTAIVFGISSWVVFSGIWVESALLVVSLPEGPKVPALIGLVSQLGQLGPILYFLLKCKCLSCLSSERRPWVRRMKKKEISDRLIIYGLFTIGLVASIILSLFWFKTYDNIFGINIGKPRSLVFFTCVFCLAILDCTCTIVFLTYIGSFKGNHSNYITGLYIGEGISSLLPSLFALAQGTGDDTSCGSSNSLIVNSTNSSFESDVKKPRFSVSVYFWLLFGTLFVSFIGFLFLEFWPSFRKEKSKSKFTSIDDLKVDEDETEYLNQDNLKKSDVKKSPLDSDGKKKNLNQSLDKFFLLFLITLVSFFLYGFVPGLSSYSALPYGLNIMHLCSTLGLITQPISSLIATFYEVKSTKTIGFIFFLSVLISSYIIICSGLSPCPPLINYQFGGYLMIAAWILSFGLLMYLRCVIASALKNKHGAKSLVWCGLLTQLGQFFGSIATILLIEKFEIFTDPCEFKCKL